MNWVKLMDFQTLRKYLYSFVIGLTRPGNLDAPRNVCDSSENKSKNENENVEVQGVHNKADVIDLPAETRSKVSVPTARGQTVKMALSRQKYIGVLELVLIVQP